ncbi:MAG: phage tail length tape measure family protein [Rhodanobacter sp.]
MSNDEEIKVALTADPSDLEDGMQTGADAVTEGAQTMQAAVEESAATVTAAHTAIGESAEAAAARIKAMVAASLEQQGANSAIGESERSLAERMGQRVEATAAQIAATQASIAAQDAQMVSMEEFTGAQEEGAAASEVATVALEENTAAMVVNGGVARELGVLLGEGLRGNFTRMEGSAVTLSNRLGLMSAIFSPLGLTIAAAGGAAVLFADEVMKGEEQSNAFNKALIETGGTLAVTQGQFNGMAESLRSSETTIGTAREAMMDFAQSGRIGGAELQAAGQAAVDFAALTGESMQKAVSAIVKIEEDPVKALKALNDQYHFLTLAQLEHIQQLENEGQKTQAATEAIELFGKTNTDRLAQADADVGTLVTWWRNLKGAISDAGDEVQAFGRNQTLEDQIERVKKQIADVKAGYVQLGEHIDVYNPFHPMVADTSLLEEKLAGLERQAGDNRLATSQKAAAQATQDAAIAAKSQNDEVLKGMKGTSEYTAALDKELAALKQIHDANANDPAVKGIDFDAGGNATGGDGLAKIETYLHKKYDLKQKAGEDEHKLDQQQLAQEEADQGVSNANKLAFELNFWQQKLEAAKTGSKEYAQAYKEVESLTKEIDADRAREAKKADAEILKSRLAALDQARAAFDGDIQTQKQQYQLEFDEGKISADQLAQLEKDLVQKKLAADIAYLTDKENLDQAAGASGVSAANKEAAAIVQIKQKAAQNLLTIEEKQLTDSQKQWSKYSNQIAGSFKTALNGMLFNGETLKQGMASIGETIAEDFIQSAIEKPLQKWIAAEATKLQATIGTLTGQAAATNTQRAADASADAVASVASVTRASGVAGAMGTASFAGAPWPVDMGAPAFGASMAALAMGYSSIASAAGGWGQVPSDQMAQIHKDEMILPAHIADFVRSGASAGNSSAASSGGGGGGPGGGETHIHFQINAMDARTFQTALRGGLGNQLAQYVKQKTQNSPQVRR